MIVMTDDKIVNVFNTKFGIPLNRMIYGQLEVAKSYWTRYNSDKYGTAMLPYLTFYRTIGFHDYRYKKTMQVMKPSGGTRSYTCSPIYLNYVVEILDDKIINQIDYIRKWILWGSGEPVIHILDAEGNTWVWAVNFEDPEDNSDLESESEEGRVVRTTFNFRVESIVSDDTDNIRGLITRALLNIHLYTGNLEEKYTVIEAEITS